MQVGLNMNVMVASSLLHASILRSGKLYVNEAAEAEFMRQCLAFVTGFQAGMDPPAPRRTFEKHWDSRYESTWRWSFMLFVAGSSLPLCTVPVLRLLSACRHVYAVAWRGRRWRCSSRSWQCMPMTQHACVRSTIKEHDSGVPPTRFMGFM